MKGSKHLVLGWGRLKNESSITIKPLNNQSIGIKKSHRFRQDLNDIKQGLFTCNLLPDIC